VGHAFSPYNFAVVNASKVEEATKGTVLVNVFTSNVITHEVGHLISGEGGTYDHGLGGVMAPGVPAQGTHIWTRFPDAIEKAAVNRFCGGKCN
jgi:hypothetical protein